MKTEGAIIITFYYVFHLGAIFRMTGSLGFVSDSHAARQMFVGISSSVGGRHGHENTSDLIILSGSELNGEIPTVDTHSSDVNNIHHMVLRTILIDTICRIAGTGQWRKVQAGMFPKWSLSSSWFSKIRILRGRPQRSSWIKPARRRNPMGNSHSSSKSYECLSGIGHNAIEFQKVA